MNRTPTITVIGTAAASAVPDLMGISLTVNKQHAQGAEAFAQASVCAGEVIAAVLEVAPNAELCTTGVALDARISWRNDESVMLGYDAQTTLEVRGLSMDDVGAVLAAAVGAGDDALRVDSLRVEVSNPEPALKTARELAFADARAKAEHLALLAGSRLGSALRIRECPEAPTAPVQRVMASPLAAASMPVLAGHRELSVSLEVRWELVAAHPGRAPATS